MRSKADNAGRGRARRRAMPAGFAARLGLFVLLSALAAPVLLVGVRGVGAQSRPAPRGGADAPAKTPVKAPAKAPVKTDGGLFTPAQPAPAVVQPTPAFTSARVKAASVKRVNFKQMAAALSRAAVSKGVVTPQAARPPMTIRESAAGAAASAVTPSTPIASALQAEQGGPLVPSPAPSSNYLAQEDSPKVGTGVVIIPPDTMGAVGPDKVFVTVNNNYRIQNKATGAPLSTVSIDTFWAATGATGAFDPRIQYDPYQGRWLLAATSNAQSANSSVLLGISDTSDPQGTYTLYRFIVGCAAGVVDCNAQGEWADFPMLGFNKNWIAIGWNQFNTPGTVFVGGKMAVIDYPTARTGTADGTLFTNFDSDHNFCMHPATTFSATEETLYIPVHQQSVGAVYHLHKITGTPAAPTLTYDETERVRPGGGWTQPDGDALPQQCIAGVGLGSQTCPASPRKIDSGDAFIRGNVVFRNGKIWYPQNIALPGTGTLTLASRFAVQWTALNPDGTFSDGGRVEDATATTVNGGKHYAYSSISVNRNNDVLLGFSEFESDDYADAGYAFRLGTDAAGTMRDPVIYKEGEDYYEKTFGGGSNRWGDYSHTVVDPSNDRDLWTIQEYAALRTGATGLGANDSHWGTWWAKVAAPAGAGDLVISEFRLNGPGGVNDEYIEVYNNSGSPLTVQTADGSASYAVAADDGVTRFTIPNGTVIPERGHYLGCNSAGYSLASYPAGVGATATCDATYTANITSGEDTDPGPGITIAPRQGIALFRTADAAQFNSGNRLDAAGFVGTANTLYREGGGIPNLTFLTNNYALYRDTCGKGGSMTILGACPTGGFPKDTNDNSADFIYTDTGGADAGIGKRLGAPGPKNLSSPVQRNDKFAGPNLDATISSATPPNRVRDFNSVPAQNSTFGTLDIRKRIINNTGANVTRLRFRVVDITTFDPAAGFADLRPMTSTATAVSGINDGGTCGALPMPCTVTVEGTTLETPPSQPSGGGFNSTLSVTLATPIPPGGSVNVRFLLGIQQTGTFKFFINVEALP